MRCTRCRHGSPGRCKEAEKTGVDVDCFGEVKRMTRGRLTKLKRRMIVFFLLCVSAGLSAAAAVPVPVTDVCASCHVNATCEDKPDGSGKVCHCKYGFVGNGRSFCQDKDECQIGAVKICGQHTKCHNTYGSYYCTCESGYSPSNNMAVFIPNDGTHCQGECGLEAEDGYYIDECRITGLCGEGGLCRNLDGSFECTCQLGYRVHNGSEPFQPQRDQASCRVTDCGQPVSAQNSVLLSATGTTYDSLATFICDNGFVWAKGNNMSVCGADGQWSRPTMICKDVDCGSPPALAHARTLWNKTSRMGSEVFYQCNSGYHNVGKGNVSICNAAGQWAEPHMLCKETLCGNPPVSVSTERVWNGSTAPGSTVLYICKNGFYSNGGHNVSVCIENGEWTTPGLSCQEILCGDPPVLLHTGQVRNGSSSPGSTVKYFCKTGFYQTGGNSVSLCTANGSWTKPNISCKEVQCGAPPSVPHSVVLWNEIPTVGSRVVYECKSGYHRVGGGNVSVCTVSGEWNEATLLCQEISCGLPLTFPHSNLLWDHTSRPGSVVLYECTDGFYQESGNNISVCSLSGEWGEISVKCRAKCGPVPSLVNSEVVWHNRSVVIHRCMDGYHSWRGSNISVCGSSGVWHKSTLSCIETKPPISHLRIVNEKCVHWRAEKYEGDTEAYKVIYVGTRDYQRTFRDNRQQSVKSKAEQLEVCLTLLPLTNYSVSITALSARFTASVTTNTSLTAPPVPVIHYTEFETPAPTLSLHRSTDSLDPISSYQVFVLPVEEILVFDCSSPVRPDPLSSEYITAQIFIKHVGTEINFTVGDGLHYGGFYNAPLEKGRTYYVVLQAVTQWKTAVKSSCVLWAKIRGTNYVLKVSSLCAAASVALAALAIMGGYSCFWFFKKT